MNLVKYQTDTLELHIDQETGLAYANFMAISRMLGVAKQTIFDAITVRNLQGKTARIQTTTGLKTARLFDASDVFKLAIKYNLELAEAMGACGANVYMCGIAGYQVSIIAPPPKPPTKELTRREILNIAIAAEDRAEALAAQIEADSEKTALGATIAESTTKGIRIGEFAKTIGMGQNKYFEELRDCGIICQTSTLPYQKHLSAKYFVVTQVCHNSKWYPVALVTPKGQAYLAKRHQQWIERETVVRLIEAEVTALV